MKADLADLKHHNNADRAWRITLQPKESYTWVISTSENYKEENFRGWGFRWLSSEKLHFLIIE